MTISEKKSVVHRYREEQRPKKPTFADRLMLGALVIIIGWAFLGAIYIYLHYAA